jgi:2,4-dienoyl-CoA reductase-like NADH-dependent reductase (Old Yellow Enzyme family)
MYSSTDGLPDDWHLTHLGARAAGGFGLVLTEASAVLPEGRISPQDAGIWNDEQASAWQRVVEFAHQRGAAIGVQLAHAGRKGSTYRPWAEEHGSVPLDRGGWRTVGPSALAFPGYAEPEPLSREAITEAVAAFAAAARRAVGAGFDTVEIHAAHGYLLHEFLSPLSNRREDEYGGSFDNRARFLIETVEAVRATLPDTAPLLVRISATDWVEGGWTLEQSTKLAGRLKDCGVDLVDVSSGGNVPADVAVGPGYQVPLASEVRAAGLPVGAVGMITEPRQAEEILAAGHADVVFLARASLREPSWPLRAAHELGVPAEAAPWPDQYRRGHWPVAG